MAYIPPHKRQSKDSDKPSPTPESLIPQWKRGLSFGSSSGSRLSAEKKKNRESKQWFHGGRQIIYAPEAVSRWITVGLADHSELPSFTRLEPFPLESIERKFGEKPLALVLHDHPTGETDELRANMLKRPWDFVAENVQHDLFSSFQHVKHEMEAEEFEQVKPNLVFRFGNILFHGSPSLKLESIGRCPVSEATLRQLRRSFHTNVPSSHMEYVTNEVVPLVGLTFEEEKELYHVKLADTKRPDITISCKCKVIKDYKKLELYKIELNQVRHLVVDMVCLAEKLDLRLMLFTKKILTALTDDEMNDIRSLINSAILDPEVKGGLRWPLGKDSLGDRYTVIGVWHTQAKTFKSSSIRLKVRLANRFDFKTSAGEVTQEVSLKMTGILAQLLEEAVDFDLIARMLRDNLKLIWDLFLT